MVGGCEGVEMGEGFKERHRARKRDRDRERHRETETDRDRDRERGRERWGGKEEGRKKESEIVHSSVNLLSHALTLSSQPRPLFSPPSHQKYDKMFKANDTDVGGSFYIQSKIYRAKEALDIATAAQAPPPPPPADAPPTPPQTTGPGNADDASRKRN